MRIHAGSSRSIDRPIVTSFTPDVRRLFPSSGTFPREFGRTANSIPLIFIAGSGRSNSQPTSGCIVFYSSMHPLRQDIRNGYREHESSDDRRCRGFPRPIMSVTFVLILVLLD